MTDITQRLRESAKAARALDRAALLNEAADEIERLRISDEQAWAIEHAAKLALLRERERTNLDAAPAAKAAKESLARGTDADGTGDTHDSQTTPGQCSTPREGTSEPVAWAALHDDGDIAWIGYTPDGAADGACGRKVVPLYRLPTLTDAEREALSWFTGGRGPVCAQYMATIRGLLERTK